MWLRKDFLVIITVCWFLSLIWLACEIWFVLPLSGFISFCSLSMAGGKVAEYICLCVIYDACMLNIMAVFVLFGGMTDSVLPYNASMIKLSCWCFWLWLMCNQEYKFKVNGDLELWLACLPCLSLIMTLLVWFGLDLVFHNFLLLIRFLFFFMGTELVDGFWSYWGILYVYLRKDD